MLMAGIAVEAIAPLCIVTGRGDRQAATILAGFCAATALLYHPFWKHEDLFAEGKSKGREELWEFLKNFGLIGGLMYVALDERPPARREESVPRSRRNERH